MPNKRFFNLIFVKLITTFVILLTILWLGGMDFISPPEVEAAVTERTPATELITSGQTIKANSDYTALFGFSLTQDGGETLSSVTLQINEAAGTVSSSDFDGVRVYADTGLTDDVIDGLDTVCGTETTVNVGSPTTINTGTCAIPGSGTGDYDFIVAIKTSSTISNGDSFGFEVSAGTDTYVLSLGAVSATALTSDNSLTADTIAPQATSVGGPPDGESGAPIDALVDRVFSENLSSSSVEIDNVLLQVNEGNVQGGNPTGSNLCTSVELKNNNQIICNHDDLNTETWYTFTITTGVTDLAGNPLASDFTAQFQTGSFGGGAEFNPPPFVIGTYPAPGTTFPVNSKIMIDFSRSMRTSGDGSVLNVNNIQLYQTLQGAPTGSNLFTSVSGWNWDSDESQLIITPPSLTANNWYRVVIKGYPNFDPQSFDPNDPPCGGTGEPGCVLSEDGLPIPGPDFFIDFQATSADNDYPALRGSYPANKTIGIDRAVYDLALSYDDILNPDSITAARVRLYKDNDASNIQECAYTEGDSEVTGITRTLDSDGKIIHISPNTILDENQIYIIVVHEGIEDLVGNATTARDEVCFETSNLINGEATDNTSPQVVFANADNFGIFITFSEPMKFDATANASESSSDGVSYVNNLNNWTLETSPDGTNWMEFSLSGKTVYYEPHSKTLEISNLMMPPGNYFRVTGSTNIRDLSNNGLDSNANTAQGIIQSAHESGGMLKPGEMAGPVDYFEMGMTPISVFPKSALAGATTRYKVELSTDVAIPASGRITLTFPTGFSFANSCNTWLTDTFENADINGPATGIVTVSSISCSSVSRIITITLGSTGTLSHDMLRFEIQGVINSSMPKDFTTSGYTVDIKTYNASGALLESKTSMPFFIVSPGERTISGKVFIDTDSDGVLDAGESGVEDIKICLGGPLGFNCTTTDGNGNYSFSQLNDGFYHIDIPPLTSGTVTGGPFFRDINISGSDVTEDFPVQQASSEFILDVYVAGTGLDGTKLDVFAFSSAPDITEGGPMMGPGGFVVRECTMGTDCDDVQLPLSQGRWEVGVGPWMPKEPGAPPPPPDFTFMPPKPVEVRVTTAGVPDLCTTGAGADKELCFTLTAATLQIKGKVVDGSGTALPNVFVMARPAFMEGEEFGAAGASQTDNNGLFNIKVVSGTYIVDAYLPGMPPTTTKFECTAKDNTGVSDNNATADIYCNGTLIVNDISGFAGSSITLADVTDNDLILKIAKSSTSISGRVLDDSGNPIPFAHVEGTEVDDSGNPFGAWVDAPTDNSGNYTLYVFGGPAGSPKKWKIRAFAPGFGELPSITVAIVDGEKLTGKNLQVTSADFGTVTGTVTKGGTPVSGAFVNIHGPNGGNGTVTDDSGAYTLKVRAGSNYTIDGFIPGQGPTSVITGVTITAGQTLSGQDLTMAQPGTLMVYVCTLSDPSSAPSATNTCADRKVSGAFVDARDANGRGYGTSSNPTMGQYELILPAGTYTIKASEPAVGLIGTQTDVTVTANQTTYINIIPPPLYEVSGTVTSSDSACIEGATVFLTESTSGRVILVQVSSDGSWSKTNIPNGTYLVGAGKPGCVDSADPGLINVSGNNLSANDDSDLVRTLVKADATVSGRVTLDGSNVSFETMVFATSSGGKVVATRVDTSQTSGTNYTLNLTEGTWTLKARSDGYESSTASLTISSGDSMTQNLTLSAIPGYTRKEPKPFSIKPSRGGIVKNLDIHEDFELNIPPGALGTSSNDGSVLTKETTAVVAETGTQTVVGGKGVEVTPKDASGQPITTLSSSEGSAVTITIPYTEADVTTAGGTENQIILAAWSDEKQQWEPLSTTCDTTNNKCTATITHFSTIAPIVSKGGGAPSTPTGLTATAVSTSQIDLYWNAVEGATGYDVYRSTSATGTFARLGSEPTVSGQSNTSYSDTGLSAGTTYYYKVSALNASGESAASSAVSATTSSAGGAVPISFIQPQPAPEEEEVVEEEEVAKEAVPEEEVVEEKTLEERLAEIEMPILEKPITEMTIDELKAKIEEFQGVISQLQAILAEMITEIPGIPSDFSFERNLRPGEVSDDVKYLQIVLNSDPDTQVATEGPGSPGNETNYFGPLTKSAVIKFQQKYADDVLAPWGITKGTGFVGSTSRTKLNELLGR